MHLFLLRMPYERRMEDSKKALSPLFFAPRPPVTQLAEGATLTLPHEDGEERDKNRGGISFTPHCFMAHSPGVTPPWCGGGTCGQPPLPAAAAAAAKEDRCSAAAAEAAAAGDGACGAPDRKLENRPGMEKHEKIVKPLSIREGWP